MKLWSCDVTYATAAANGRTDRCEILMYLDWIWSRLKFSNKFNCQNLMFWIIIFGIFSSNYGPNLLSCQTKFYKIASQCRVGCQSNKKLDLHHVLLTFSCNKDLFSKIVNTFSFVGPSRWAFFLFNEDTNMLWGLSGHWPPCKLW